MSAAGTPFESQARLWLVAFGVSALLNVVALGVIGLWAIASIALRPVTRPTEAEETVAIIMPRMELESVPVALEPAEGMASERMPQPAQKAPPKEADPSADRPFVRTSPDQSNEAPETPDFIGERNTVATSDAPPSRDTPGMAQQKGREPESEGEMETTESHYQDGEMLTQGPDRIGELDLPVLPMSGEGSELAESSSPAASAGESPPVAEPAAAKESLLEGPLPVDRRVTMAAPEEAPKPALAERQPEEKEVVTGGERPAELPKPAASVAKPGFRGNQSKTRLEGSIDRTGRSALNVEDSVLGRYHASVSRAVEKAWQLHCVRNRDYITPGQLTLRVMLDPTGKVRSMSVVEEIGVGNIQKGFTLTSIREAEIPLMPAPLKKQLDGEPLELIYRFNF